MMSAYLNAANSFKADIAIDLGTANTIVIKRGAGVVFEEPTICCFAAGGRKRPLVAAGTAASQMAGRLTDNLRIARPLRGGVLSDIEAGREMLRYAVRANRGWPGSRLSALIGVPADATQAERSALKTVAHDAGIRKVELLPEPLLAAIGVGLDITQPRGRMLVDCGAGTTEVAVISLASICLSKSVRIGGDTLEEGIADHLHLRHRFHIGPHAAEGLKREAIRLLEEGGEAGRVTVRGQNLATGLPETLELPCSELLVVFERHLKEIVSTITAALAETPPELSQDIFEDGIVVTGGASMVNLLKKLITKATGLEVRSPDQPLNSVAAGLEKLLEEAWGRS
ncbi:rod shape-determining protein [Allosphingosinicella vermicomposti]|uniref:rod shape-determining protein n=1 Tax=Allosphingosinicella vermicomposti TaxID=614671 RepID=UPI000D0EA8A5|nr:rod shape-determining protein [Allosphingosinicella vermicomposti]